MTFVVADQTIEMTIVVTDPKAVIQKYQGII